MTSNQPSWMPSDEEIERHVGLAMLRLCARGGSESSALILKEAVAALRIVVRSAVEKALAEQRAEWISTLKAARGEYTCHPDFAEMWAKAEADPTYWAELLRSSRDAYHKQDARHAREIERARLEGKIEMMTQVGGYADQIAEVRAAMRLLALEGEP